jgi:hypothetical protein
LKYRKKPVVVNADIYCEGMEDGFLLEPFLPITPTSQMWAVSKIVFDNQHVFPYIKTLEGNHFISKGDYIITGVQGERYPCKPDIFDATYEPVD